MAETKSRILYILKYLWQNTDAEHYATTGDILTYLKENGISCDRKTIPGDIAKLCDIGIDIEEERSRENRYSLSSHLLREFIGEYNITVRRHNITFAAAPISHRTKRGVSPLLLQVVLVVLRGRSNR